ncbi:hypothetical protein ABZ826_38400 [Streptomyces sp. NPDC047515]|uniref:hypothetical protein n=1 Tax=Streptomyces sp. NPDC047515 TaxID=3155380 RepID=UPI00340F4C99
MNGTHTPKTDSAGLTNDIEAPPQGFMIRFNELNVNASVRSDGLHATETVGWIASTV